MLQKGKGGEEEGEGKRTRRTRGGGYRIWKEGRGGLGERGKIRQRKGERVRVKDNGGKVPPPDEMREIGH